MHLTQLQPLSATARTVRITHRRIVNGWRSLPNWLQDGLTACAIAVPVWLLIVAVLLVG